jgi:hypothetical protein
MRDVHKIRLRGPWQVEPLARYVDRGDGTWDIVEEQLPAASKAKMPVDWADTLGAAFHGKVRYVRPFQQPTGLEEGEEVWLVVEPPCSHGEIQLNCTRLGEVHHGRPAARFDVTALLAERNRLEITVAHPQLDSEYRPMGNYEAETCGGLIGDIWLEIGFP